jgi:hypothetical protein
MVNTAIHAAPPTFRLPAVPNAAELLRSRTAAALAPLVPRETLADSALLADQFPAPVLTACCECRLDANDARVDLALCVLPASDDRTRAALDACDQHSWAASTRFLRAWSAFESNLTAAIPFVWVAFDLERPHSRLPVPCLGLCVDSAFLPRRLGLSVPGTDPSVEPLELARITHRALWDRPLPARTAELMTRALRSSEARATAKHFSYMSSREPATFKLDVRLKSKALGPFLDTLGWPGPSARIAARVRELAPEQTELQLNLVLEPELVQPLEVELLTDPSQTTNSQRQALLERLVDAGICSQEKAEVLRRVTLERTPQDPAGISWYVKVRMLDGEAESAKAYVGITPRFAWK